MKVQKQNKDWINNCHVINMENNEYMYLGATIHGYKQDIGYIGLMHEQS